MTATLVVGPGAAATRVEGGFVETAPEPAARPTATVPRIPVPTMAPRVRSTPAGLQTGRLARNGAELDVAMGARWVVHCRPSQ